MKTYKPFSIGFFVGFLGTFFATFGLLFQFVELFTFFFLGITRFIILPLLPLFTNLPGAANMLVLAIINGAVYGLIFEIIARVVLFLRKTV